MIDSAASIEVENLEIRRGSKKLFSGLSFGVSAGRLLVIRGPNGSGKTSLIRTLAGLAEATSGSVVWRDARRAEIEDPRFCISYVAHHPAVHPVFSPTENLRLGLGLQGRAVADGTIRDLFKLLGLPSDLPSAKLSQGQQRRLALAQLSLGVRPAWLLDEPLTALDDAAVGWFRGVLAQHLRSGGLCVMSLHQDFDWPSEQIDHLRLVRPKTPGRTIVERNSNAGAVSA